MRGRSIRNVVHYVTARYMRLNKKRTLTTFLGIVFTVLLMTCVFVGRESSIAYLEEVASQKNGKWHYSISDATPQVREEIEALPYVTGTAASYSLGLTDFPATGSEERPYLNVKAYEPQALEWNNIRLTQGRLPETSKEVVLSSACLEDGAAVKLGDTLDAAFFTRSITGLDDGETKTTYFPAFGLEIDTGATRDLPLTFPYFPENPSFRIDKVWNGRAGQYTVVGFIETPGFEPGYGAGYTALTLADEALQAQGGACTLFLRVDLDDSPVGAPALLWQIAGEDKVEENNHLLAFSANSSDATMNLMVNLMTAFFLLLILAVSVVLIYNVFNISFRERSRYLGMLSSVGATARQKRSSVYFEAGTLLLAALPVGILAGFGVVLGGLRLIEPYVCQLVYADIPQEAPEVHLVLSWKALLCVVLASVVTVLLSAFLPARKIGKIGPIASIQGSGEVRPKSCRTRIRGSAEGMLAHGFLRRMKRSQRSLLLAVTAFLLVLVVASFGISRVIDVISQKTEVSFSLAAAPQEDECVFYYDRSAENAQAIYDALKQDMETRPQVVSVKEWYSSMFCLDVERDFYSQEYWEAYLDIAEVYLGRDHTREQLREQYILNRDLCTVSLLVPDDDTLRQIAQRCGADQSLLFGGMGAILINEAQLDSDNYGFENKKPQRYRYFDIQQPSSVQPGASFPVSVYNTALETNTPGKLTMAGYASGKDLAPVLSVHGGELWLLLSRQSAEELVRSAGYAQLSDYLEAELRVQLAPGQEDFVTMLRQSTEDQDVVHFSAWNDPDYTGSIAQSLCAILRILLAAFVALSSVICLLNLWNAIHGRMLERQRDLAVLRSVGATGRQLERMLVLECLGLLGKAFILAALLSGVLIYGIQRLLSDLFGHLVFRLPWGLLAFALVFTAGAVLLITLHSVRREQNLIDCIRKDSV